MAGSEQDIRNLKTQIAVTETTFERLQLLDALEVAVCADQIEKDAAIVERERPEMGTHINGGSYRQGKDDALVIALMAIRAQLGGGN